MCIRTSDDTVLNLLQGTAVLANASPPLTTLGGSDGAGQMQHFVKDDDLNTFRLRMSLPCQFDIC